MSVSDAAKNIVRKSILDIVVDILDSGEEEIVKRLKDRDRIPQNPRDLMGELNVWEFCESSAVYDSTNAVEYLEALDKDVESISEGDDWRSQIIDAANAAVISAAERVLRDVFGSLQEKVDEWYGEYTAAAPFEYTFDLGSDSLEISVMTDQYDPGEDNNVWGVIYVPINY
jgi:hypothetical protein